jgi:predicted nucleic-acid-binding Zn-ribbon protein
MEVETVEQKPENRSFDAGNLVVECKCGNKEVLQEGIEANGIQMILPLEENATWQLGCAKCGSVIKMYFEEVIKEKNDGVSDNNETEEPIIELCGDAECDVQID